MNWLSIALARRAALAALAAAILPAAMPAHAQSAPFCPEGRSPTFVFGFASLDDQLGTSMGEPLECEHPNFSNGDVLQRTTTGLAYWRPGTNISAFTTDGANHWALVTGRLVYWHNTSVEPPQPTTAQSMYLTESNPLVAQVDEAIGQLAAIQDSAAAAGNLDAVPVADIGAFVDSLTAAHDHLQAMDPPPALSVYHQNMLQTADATTAAASTLLRAQVTQNRVARDAFIAQAGEQLAEAHSASSAARDTYSTVLPVAVAG
jgi:hypothetical protein